MTFQKTVLYGKCGKMKSFKRIAVIVLLAAMTFGALSIRAAASPEYKTLEGDLTAIAKYGNVTVSIPLSEMAENGYELGDVLTVSFLGKTVDAPFCGNYPDVDAGTVGAFSLEGYENLILAVNMGNFASAYGIADKVTHEGGSFEWVYKEGVETPVHFVVSMKEKRGYYDDLVVRQLAYTNERSDYPDLTDEEFANFRAVKTTGIKENVLFRSASPVDPSIGRSGYADDAYRAHGIEVIMNLADSEEALTAFEGYGETYYSGAKHIALNTGVDFTEDDFREKLAQGLRFFAENKGVYAVHCKEGKDRAGFTVTLLELLMGASYEEIRDDYMISFYNYYGVKPGDAKYDSVVSNNLNKVLSRAFGINDIENAPLNRIAEDYLKGLGLTDGEIASLRANLAPDKNYAPENAGAGEKSPQTGDGYYTAVPLMLCVFAASGLAVLAVKRKHTVK